MAHQLNNNNKHTLLIEQVRHTGIHYLVEETASLEHSVSA